MFDTNDFDETLPGPFEWDVKRLVASFAVDGRDGGFDDRRRQAINLRVGRSYREAIARFASMSTVDVWYSRVDVEDLIAAWSAEVSDKAVKRAERNVAKARTKDSLAAFKKLTRVVDGEPRIVSNPPLIVPVSELFTGEQEIALFLQMKEAEASVPEPFLGPVERDFHLRQLWDSKGSAQVETMQPKTMEAYAEICGQTLARHERRIRPGARSLRRGVRRPERVGLRRAEGGRRFGPDRGANRPVTTRLLHGIDRKEWSDG